MTKFNTADAECIDVTEDKARAELASWLDAVGLPSDSWPLSTDMAAGILREGGEYSVDERELERLGEMGHVPRIAVWDARDVIAAAAALEGRRAWRSTPSKHDFKKHPSRIGLEQNLSAGREAIEKMLGTLKQFDLPLVLAMLAESDDREMRERLIVIVMALKAGEVFGIGGPNLPQPADMAEPFNTEE
jgi:hypothetical protein